MENIERTGVPMSAQSRSNFAYMMNNQSNMDPNVMQILTHSRDQAKSPNPKFQFDRSMFAEQGTAQGVQIDEASR